MSDARKPASDSVREAIAKRDIKPGECVTTADVDFVDPRPSEPMCEHGLPRRAACAQCGNFELLLASDPCQYPGCHGAGSAHIVGCPYDPRETSRCEHGPSCPGCVPFRAQRPPEARQDDYDRGFARGYARGKLDATIAQLGAEQRPDKEKTSEHGDHGGHAGASTRPVTAVGSGGVERTTTDEAPAAPLADRDSGESAPFGVCPAKVLPVKAADGRYICGTCDGAGSGDGVGSEPGRPWLCTTCGGDGTVFDPSLAMKTSEGRRAPVVTNDEATRADYRAPGPAPRDELLTPSSQPGASEEAGASTLA